MEADGLRFSYADLDARANQLAHYLLAAGVAPGARVAILLPRSLQTYVALLAVLKAGGTFVPIDPSSPADRVGYMVDDAQVDLVLTTTALAALTVGSQPPTVHVDELESALAALPITRPSARVEGDPAAYIIYTSGSSGRPKGVAVAQSSICNFISVVPPLYRVTASDRVYQGMTIAFDFSIEEIWPTWAVGATVVAGPNDGRRLGTELGEFLHENRISVLYCVPTLLATIDRELPLVHTLNVGGEACPRELVERWATGGRVMLNTYGPTEATVTATMAELVPGRRVTIGHPLPTYEVLLLDVDLEPVAEGEIGEICIAGPGVAMGYVGQPDLTAERFVTNPLTRTGRVYRTGDLGRWTPDGIEYLGRADNEVKVRGYRVDLQEIDNQLRQDPAVADAVTVLSEPTKELAAYVTRVSGELDEPDELVGRVHESLRGALPPYMVPAYLTVLNALPMLASGKVDRKSLPDPVGARLVGAHVPYTPPATPLEEMVCEVWGEVLRVEPTELSTTADFFVDLGGHSLAAATVVSTLRRREVGVRLAIRDLYANPTVAGLAQHLSAEGNDAALAPAEGAAGQYGSLRVAVAGLGQLTMLYALLLVFSLPVALVYSANGGVPSRTVMVTLLTLLPLTYLGGRWLLPVVGVRLLSVGLRPGSYPLWGAVHLRVWAVEKLMNLSPAAVLSGSPLLNPYLRALGAQVGPGSHLASGDINLPRFVEINRGVSVGYGVQLHAGLVESGRLTIGPVVVGENGFVGASSMVVAGSVVGAGSALGEHSVLGPGEAIPDGERWAGSPSAPAPSSGQVWGTMTRGSAPATWSRKLMVGFYAGLVALEALPLVTILPVVLLVWWVLLSQGLLAGFAVAAVSGPLYVVTVCLTIAGLRVMVVERTPTGILPLRSTFGLSKWFTDKLLEASLVLTNSLYATLYTIPWLRMLGARIGAGSEVSTVAHMDPDLLVLQPQSFIADMARVGSATYHNGLVAVERTEVGQRAFVGNACFIPAGSSLGSDSLVGVHTVPPPGGVPAGTSWLGSPAIHLPRRQESQAFAETLTYRPSRWRVLERFGIEFLRVTLPASLLAMAVYIALLAVAVLAAGAEAWVVVLAAPAAFLGMGLAVVLLVACLKWLLVGRYTARVEPLWSRFVRRSELVTGLYEAAAVPALLQALTGTPLLGLLLRLFGAKVGRRVLMESTFLTEFDLVQLGDDTVVGTGASLQTHLFEDRVMKMSVVSVERGASIGPRSVLLYDSIVGSDATVGPLSLVMKGEALTPGTRWVGIPAEFAAIGERTRPTDALAMAGVAPASALWDQS